MQAFLDIVCADGAVTLVLFAAAALTASMPGPRVAWIVAALGAVGGAALATIAALHFFSGQAGSLGTLVDGACAFVTPLLAWCTALILIGANIFRRDALERATPIALALVLLVSGGWMVALQARDWLTLVVGAEIGTLSSLALAAVSSERDRGGLNGAIRLYSASVASSALLLLGVGMIARASGSLTLAALPLAAITMPAIASVGVALIVTALAMRAGVAPLHAWTSALFGRSGDLAVLTIGVVGCVGALGVLLRVASYALPVPAIGEIVAQVLAVLGVASVCIGSVQAIGAVSIRRLGGYANAAQAGCILLAAALGSPAGYGAGLVLLFGFAAAGLACFAGAAAAPGERPYAMDMIDGLGRRAPLAGGAIAAAALSYMGAPLTMGFLGRWQLMEASVGAEWWWAASAGIAASLAGVFFGGRLIERLYFRRIVAVAGPTEVWRLSWAPALIAGIFGVAVALAPESLVRVAAIAGASLAEIAR